MNTSQTPLLQLKQLRVSFSQQGLTSAVVHGVDLELHRGETLGLVGESGSGKSVTAMAIPRLLPLPAATIQASEMVFDDLDLTEATDEQLLALRGKRIAMIFQEPMTALNPVQTIGQQLAEMFAIHEPSMAANSVQARCIELLQQVEINNAAERLKQYPHELSGGMRQRVMIAMAIACEPDLLIADEPTTALDVTVQRDIMDLLQKLQQQIGMAMLLISHDLPLVKHYADRIAVMHKGHIVETQNANDLFQTPQQDYTKTLLNADCNGHAAAIAGDAKPAIEVANLQVRFPLKKGLFGRTLRWLEAVNRVSFEVAEGETLGIVGESGSGKTTLIKALLRLQNSQGQISLNGQRLDTLSQRQLKPLRQQIQVVLQDPFGSLSPRQTVSQIIQEGLDIHSQLSRTEKRQCVVDVLAEVNLTEDMLGRYAHEFSGGQRQRIAIARALVMQPKVLILDEPTSALDRSIQVQIIELLKTLQRDRNLSYVFISHDLHVVRAISHRIAVMRNGVIVEQGDTATVFDTPQQAYTQSLMAASF